MEKNAIHREKTIGLNREDVVFATIPGDKDLAVITQGSRACSGDGEVIHVSADSYVFQVDKSSVLSKLRRQLAKGHVSKGEMAIVDAVLLQELVSPPESHGSGNEPQRGDVYLAAPSNEPMSLIPVIVLRDAEKNGQVLVAPMITKLKERMQEHTVFMMKGRLNTALLESIRPVDRGCLFKKIGKVDKEIMTKVIGSLAACLALPF